MHLKIICILSIALSAFLYTNWLCIVTPDGADYLGLADRILDGTYWTLTVPPVVHLDYASATRTPMYPAMLALVKIFGVSNQASGLYLNLILLAGLIFACLAIKQNSCSKLFLVCAFVIPLMICRVDYGFSLISFTLCEWPAAILVLLAALIIAFKKNTYFLMLILTALALLKPVFLLPTVVITISYLLSEHCLKAKKIKIVALLLVYLLPILLFMSFNKYRQDTFQIAPYGGFSLLGLSSQFSHADIEATDSQLLSRFIEYVNTHKQPTVTDELNFDIATLYIDQKYDHNLWEVAYNFSKQNKLTAAELNSLSIAYAVRAILNAPFSYLKYIASGVWQWWPSLAIGLIGLVWIKIRSLQIHTSSIYQAYVCAFFLHLANCLISSATIAALSRYAFMTAPALYTLLILAFFSLAYKPAKEQF